MPVVLVLKLKVTVPSAPVAPVPVTPPGSVETETVEPRYKYQPSHPLAIQEGRWKGHVAYPRIDMTTQFVDALEATRAYEANIGVMEMTKNMSQQTLRILA